MTASPATAGEMKTQPRVSNRQIASAVVAFSLSAPSAGPVKMTARSSEATTAEDRVRFMVVIVSSFQTERGRRRLREGVIRALHASNELSLPTLH